MTTPDAAIQYQLKQRLRQDNLRKPTTPDGQRRIFVRETGRADGDGTPDRPYREIKSAVASLAADGPVIRGSVVIDVGPGDFSGGIRMPPTRSSAQDDFVRIIGASRNGIPTTRIVHKAGDKHGFLAEDGASVWLENLKFIGGFAVAAQLTRNVYGWFSNIHVDGKGAGVRGLSISAHSRYYVRGGLIENLRYAGIDEYFSVSRSFATAKSFEAQMRIRNCKIGVRAKEGCVGHFDYLQVEDCAVGIELLQNSVANMKRVAFRRNRTALAIINSTSHNERTIVWGDGDDANQREVYSAGASGELRAMMWAGEEMAESSTTGHRPLFTIGNDYEQKEVTAEAGEEATITRFNESLPVAFFRTVGKHFRIVMLASASGATVDNPVTIVARIGSSLLGEVPIRSSETVRVEFDTVCVRNREEHLTAASVSGGKEPVTTVSRSDEVLSGDPSSVASVDLLARTSSDNQALVMHSCELHG